MEPKLIADVLGVHVPSRGGCLELVFLNGCLSEALGRALVAAGIPTVVCWSTRVHDQASRIFGRTFFQAVAESASYADAFDKAKLAVLTWPRKKSGTVETCRLASSTTQFDFADPKLHAGGTLPNGRLAAGLPLLLQ